MQRYFILLTVLFFVQVANAQKPPAVPPPHAPFVAPIPEKGAWTISATLPPTPTPAPGQPARPDFREKNIQTVKIGDMAREFVTYANGETTERWTVGTLYLWKPPGGEVVVSDTLTAEDGTPNPSGIRPFPGAGWIGASSYDGPVIFDKQPCYHYVAGGRETWIHRETNLPVAYTQNGILHRYTFQVPTAGPLQLPADYQQSLDQALKIVKRRQQLQKDLIR